MFIVYDKEMNVIPFPAGVKPLDIFISSISKEREVDRPEGANRKINYGFVYGEREINLKLLMKAHDTRDYRLLRNSVYAMFQNGDELYVSEEYERGKKYLVSVDESYIPERYDNNRIFAEAEISCNIVGLPFAESIGTTADIDGANLIPYADLTNASNYNRWVAIGDTSFSSSSPIKYDGYDKSFLRVNVPSASIGTNRRIRTGYTIPLIKGREYEVSFIASSSDWLNSNFNYTGILRSNGIFSVNLSNSINRTSVGTAEIGGLNKTIYKYTITFTHNDNTDNYALMIGTKQTTESSAYFVITEPILKPLGGINTNDEMWGYGMGIIADDDSLIYTHNSTSFRIFNAGNVPIHPYEQKLKITISEVLGSTGFLQLRNTTNGSTFRVNEGVDGNQNIVLDGPNVTSNGLQYFRNTNHQFIELEPGWNNFIVTGATSVKVSFDFPFYYK